MIFPFLIEHRGDRIRDALLSSSSTTNISSSFENVDIIFHSGRIGKLRILSFKIGIVLLCRAKLEEKWKCEYPPSY